DSGFLDQPVGELPDPSERLLGNLLTSGHGGGHDLHLRTLQGMGVQLVGHLEDASDQRVRFAKDLGPIVAWGDERRARFMDLVVATAQAQNIEIPDIPEPGPFDDRSPDELDLSGFGAVVFTTGFRPDYGSWLPWPDAFDDSGFPIQVDGASTVVPGLWFVGVHYLRKRKSSLLVGVGEDAAIVAAAIASKTAA
ncbi:MAG: hypothetical protein ACHQNA_12810, partial [Acidimicrobiales bacterium]